MVSFLRTVRRTAKSPRFISLLLMLATVIGSAASALFPTAMNPPIAKGDSFDTVIDGAWTYVGNAGRVSTDNSNYVSLTDNVSNQAGILWLNQEVRTPFSATFRYKAGGGTGGEGFVLMFYKNKAYSPSAGGSLAFGTTAGYGIEFDSLDNGDADPSGNHIALISGNSNNHITYVDDNRTEDNQWHWVEVEVRPFVVVVKVDDIVTLEWAGTLDTEYGGIGIGASTGIAANRHLVDDIKVRMNDTFTDATELWTFDGTPGAAAYRDPVGQNVVLTEALENRAGLMWFAQDITSPFAATFNYRAGGGTGSDGLAFMFYKDRDYEPGTGGTLGFGPDGGLASGYGIEFDSSHDEGDPVGNHIALIKDSAGGEHLAWADSRLWQRMDSRTMNDLYSIWGQSSDNVIAVGKRGTIVCYDGSAWTQTDNVTTQDLYGVWGADDGSNVFAVGHNGTVLRYTGGPGGWGNSGAWQPVRGVTTEDLYGVWGTSSNDVYAVGSSGTVVHFNGSSWTTLPGLTSQDLHGVWGSSSTDVFAVGQAGTILHFAGSSQYQMTSGVTDNLSSVWGTAPDNVYAVGTGGRILHYDGSTWTPATSASTEDIYGVWGSGPGNVIAVGAKGTVQRYDGSTWSPMQNAANTGAYGVWGTSPSDIFVAGWGGTVTRYVDVTEDNQWHWVRIYVGSDKLEVIVDDSPGILKWSSGTPLDRSYGGMGFCAATGTFANEQRVDDVNISLPDCGVRNVHDFIEYITKGKASTLPPAYDGYIYVMDSAYSPGTDGVLPEGSLNLSFNWEKEWTWDFSDTTLWSGTYSKGPGEANLALTIPQGNFTFKPELHVGCRTKGWELKSAEASVKGTAALDMDVRAEVNVGESGDPSQPINETFEKEVLTIRKTFVQMADFVPIWETVEFSVYVGCEVKDTRLSGWAQSGVTSEASVEIGAKYDDSEFSSLNDASFDFKLKPLTWDAGGNFSIRPYASARFNVSLYNIIGPTFEVEPYVLLGGELHGSSSAPTSYNYDVDAGLRLEGGISMPWFGDKASWTASKDFTRDLLEAEASPGTSPSKPITPSAVDPDPKHMGSGYTFKTKSTDNDPGDQIRYIFDWGDGTTTETGPSDNDTFVTATHAWREPGVYQVKARAKDSKGLLSKEESASLSVTILNRKPGIGGVSGRYMKTDPPTVINLPGDHLVASRSYEFSATATDPDVVPEQLMYCFSWGDGTTSMVGPIASGGTAVATHAWPKSGSGAQTYNIAISAVDQHGALSLASDAYNVAATVDDCAPLGTPSKPTGPPNGVGVVGDTYAFQSRLDKDEDGNWLDNGVPLRFTFDWGDGKVTEKDTLSHVTIGASHEWTKPGSYGVRVRAALIGGPENISPYSETVYITITNSPPVIQYVVAPESARYTNPGVSCTYKVSATDPNKGDQIRYRFDWGDGKTETTGFYTSGQEVSATHAWVGDGIYTLKIWATDPHGYTSEHWAVSVAVNSPPVPSFTMYRLAQSVDNTTQWWETLWENKVTTGELVRLVDSSTDAAPGKIVRWQWNFGDGTTCENMTEAWHTYANDGSYTATLIVWDDMGASSQKSVLIIVSNVSPKAEFVSHPISLTERDTIQFLGNVSSDSDGTVDYWQWDFGDGSTTGKTDDEAWLNPVHRYVKGAIYTVKLTVWDDDGAWSQLEKKVMAYPKAYSEDFEGALGSGWSSYSNPPDSSVNQRSDSSASRGAYSWLMSTSAGNSGRNELILHVYVLDADYLGLGVATRSVGNNPVAMPDTFTRHCDGDGIAVSNDGVNWLTLWSYTGSDNVWAQVDPAALSIGDKVALDGNVFIKFQDYEANAVPDHYLMWDEICLVSDGAVIPVPNRAPTLSDASVTLTSGGDETTLFTYRVTYTDRDGDEPSLAYAYIDGARKPMSYVSGSYSDGAVYECSTGLAAGTLHDYHFEFSDGAAVVRLPRSAETSGPAEVWPVVSHQGFEGTLGSRWTTYSSSSYGSNQATDYSAHSGAQSWRMDVTSSGETSLNELVLKIRPGDEATYLKLAFWTIGYNDARNAMPLGVFSGHSNSDGIAVSIDNEEWHTLWSYPATVSDWTQFGPLDIGAQIPLTGDVYIKFQQYGDQPIPDGGILWDDIELISDGQVASAPPILSAGSVTPASGDSSRTYVYEVTYTDAEGDAPTLSRVYVDGTAHPMTRISDNYTTGAVYRYSTMLAMGSHEYRFLFSDGTSEVTLPAPGAFGGPSVGNSPPTLSGGSVAPNPGDIFSTFRYEVTYTDREGLAPVLSNVYVDGVAENMTCISDNYSSGALYRYEARLLDGTHEYLFEFSDDLWEVRSPNASHVVADAPPRLSGARVTSDNGTEETTFVYEVTYTDPRNDAPSSATVCIDGVSENMTQVSGEYTSGALYRFSTKLASTTHSYYFLFADGPWTVTSPASGTYGGPTVTNTPPTLSGWKIDQSSGDEATTFTYEVMYQDAGNDPPSTARVYVDGVAKNMTLVSGTYAGGALYRFSTKLGVGPHTYYFQFADEAATVRAPASGTFSGPTVADAPPVLSGGSVTPLSGDADTTYTYEVTYSDVAGDNTISALVYIDGTAHAMDNVTGSYQTGALFRYSTNLSGGSHSYYFAFTDSHGKAARLPIEGEYEGPGVLSRYREDFENPVGVEWLSQVSRSSGRNERTTFSAHGDNYSWGMDTSGRILWGSNTNQLILHISVADEATFLDLSFWTMKRYDEIDGLDGIWVSNDGVTWEALSSYPDIDNTWLPFGPLHSRYPRAEPVALYSSSFA